MLRGESLCTRHKRAKFGMCKCGYRSEACLLVARCSQIWKRLSLMGGGDAWIARSSCVVFGFRFLSCRPCSNGAVRCSQQWQMMISAQSALKLTLCVGCFHKSRGPVRLNYALHGMDTSTFNINVVAADHIGIRPARDVGSIFATACSTLRTDHNLKAMST